MAWADRPTAMGVYTMKDASGSFGKCSIHVPTATTYAVAKAAMDVLRPLIESISECQVVGQSLTYSVFEDAPPAAVAGSRVEEKGIFIFRTANGGTSKIEIPAIKDTCLNTSGSINRSNTEVAALVAAMTAVDAIFTGRDGSDIKSLLKAYQGFRGSTRADLPTDK